MNPIGQPILLHDTRTGALVPGIIRDESPLSFFVEVTGGIDDGAVIPLEKSKCLNLEAPGDLPDEPDAGEAWKP